jgi:hypothetical protein
LAISSTTATRLTLVHQHQRRVALRQGRHQRRFLSDRHDCTQGQGGGVVDPHVAAAEIADIDMPVAFVDRNPPGLVAGRDAGEHRQRCRLERQQSVVVPAGHIQDAGRGMNSQAVEGVDIRQRTAVGRALDRSLRQQNG